GGALQEQMSCRPSGLPTRRTSRSAIHSAMRSPGAPPPPPLHPHSPAPTPAPSRCPAGRAAIRSPGRSNPMRITTVCLLTLALSAAVPAAQTRTAKTLDIYVVDVEGGNATLFVSPSGESVLIDTGNGGAAATRDAERIMAAVKDAGLTQIDHLITTHWHNDHFGAMAELAKRIPIRHFVDHGPTVQPNPIIDESPGSTYPELYAKGKRTIAKPGDTIAAAGLDWRIVTSAGEALKTALPGAGGAHPACAQHN